MSSVNKVILVGRLGADPMLNTTTSGKSVCNVSLATNKKWKDAGGVVQESTEWHKLVMFEGTAKLLSDYKKKGDQIYVEGELQTRQWQTQEGENRETTEVLVRQLQLL